MAANPGERNLNMETPSYLLFLLGCLGAADIALFHSVAHGIRSHPESVGELLTHSLRGPTYALLFLSIPNFEMHGLFAGGLMALFVFDLGISIWDFSLEQDSRRFLGGLPSGEYVLHMLMAIVFGALVATILYVGRGWFTAPTRLVYAPDGVPVVLRLALLCMATLVLVSGIQDAKAAFRLAKLRPTRSSRLPAERTTVCRFRKLSTENVAPVASLGPADLWTRNAPRWMPLVLSAAGVYNLLWGAWVVLFPSALFRWGGMPPNNYPQIWQCVGMIVGVYGIGYLLAAQDPFRYWPMVFVGLLGKVLGPLGMWWSVAHSGLPASMAWTCLTNDLIWWAPFALILLRASQQPNHAAIRTWTNPHFAASSSARSD
jgi:hypothetical protein